MPSYHGSTPIVDIRQGTALINEVRKGSNLVWSRVTIRDDFARSDAATLGSGWTDYGPSSDHKIGVTDGTAKIQIPDGLVGGFWAQRTDFMRYNVATASADDGYVECKIATKGDPYNALSGLAGFATDVLGRGINTNYTHGVGMRLVAGHCWIVRRVSGTPVTQGDGGTFQAGDVLRHVYIGNVHTLYVNGKSRVTWNDSGGTASKSASYRSLIVGMQGGKDLLGPRRFSPTLEYVLMA